MAARKGKDEQAIGIVDAVETLSSLADLELDRDFTVSQKHEFKIGNKKLIYRTIHWLEGNEEDKAVLLVRDVFQAVLAYIKNFYSQEVKIKGKFASQKAIEGIKDIMVLVGEAAQKLDKISKMLNSSNVKSFKELKEYQSLQNFYQRKIAKKGGDSEQTLTRLFSFAKDALVEQLYHGKVKSKKLPKKELNRVFLDFDSVKRDSEYELLLIKKDNGDPFYSSKLLRNMKLVCDFGMHIADKPKTDPLIRLPFWQDKKFQTSAKHLLQRIQHPLEAFYGQTMKYKDAPIVALLNSAMMALMLAANDYNLLNNHPAKSCGEYFADFHYFLRKCLTSPDYARLEVEVEEEGKKGLRPVLQLVRSVCSEIFHGCYGDQELVAIVHRLIESSVPDPLKGDADAAFADNLSSRLESDYESLTSLFKSQSEGPMNKMLEMLNSKTAGFDSLLQGNDPTHLYKFYLGDHKIDCIRAGAPVVQEWINEAKISPEFTAFLKHAFSGPYLKHHLSINLQDRTSWIEYARCQALEKLQGEEGIDGAFSLITLPVDTEFFYQTGDYEKVSKATEFKKVFLEQLQDTQSGFFFPEAIRKKILKGFAKNMCDSVHKLVFGSKKTLNQEERRFFLQLSYLLIVFKCIEVIQPDTFNFVCKDGIDKSAAFNGMFYYLCKTLRQEGITPIDFDIFNLILHVPGLSIRERPMRYEYFELMKHFIQAIESAPQKGMEGLLKLKKVKGLFQPATLNPTLEQI